MPHHIGKAAILICLLLSACGDSASPSEGPRARHLAELGKIADQCGLPASTFRLIGEDGVQFQPSPDAKYESVECGLTKLKNSRLPLKLGIIGNEAFEPGNGQ